jgi:hypothetical protein
MDVLGVVEDMHVPSTISFSIEGEPGGKKLNKPKATRDSKLPHITAATQARTSFIDSILVGIKDSENTSPSRRKRHLRNRSLTTQPSLVQASAVGSATRMDRLPSIGKGNVCLPPNSSHAHYLTVGAHDDIIQVKYHCLGVIARH